jgi:hypothetical protein
MGMGMVWAAARERRDAAVMEVFIVAVEGM